MIETFIDLGRGNLFRFSIAIAVFGLLRLFGLSIWGFLKARRRAGDPRVDFGAVISRTFTTLNPLHYFFGTRAAYSINSTVFHVGLILVPIFFAGHLRLWREGLGFAWPALPAGVSDALTLITVATGVLLLIGRAWSPLSRQISRPMDWVLPPLIAFEFLTGYLLAHPASNPFELSTMMLLHVYTGDALLLLTPFTKVAHCVLLPFSQLVVEMSWKLIPGAGREITKTLGKEGQPI